MNYIKTLCILLLTFNISFAQKCNLELDKIDDFTGKIERRTAGEQIAKGKQLTFFAIRTDSVYALALMAYGLKCVSNDSKLLIKFTDNSILEMRHEGGIDCDDFIGLLVNATPFLDELLTKQLFKIRLEGEFIQDFEIKNPDAFKQHLLCLKSK